MKGIKKNCCPKGSKLKEHLVVEEQIDTAAPKEMKNNRAAV